MILKTLHGFINNSFVGRGTACEYWFQIKNIMFVIFSARASENVESLGKGLPIIYSVQINKTFI